MKQVALTDVKTYLSSAGFSTDDPTALAIALGQYIRNQEETNGKYF